MTGTSASTSSTSKSVDKSSTKPFDKSLGPEVDQPGALAKSKNPVQAQNERAQRIKEDLAKRKEDIRIAKEIADVEENYWSKIESIFINGLECPVKRVDSVGGGLNVLTAGGEVKANGGDFIVTLPGGDQVVMQKSSVRLLDMSAEQEHYVAETGELIEPPVDYPGSNHEFSQPPDEKDSQGNRVSRSAPSPDQDRINMLRKDAPPHNIASSTNSDASNVLSPAGEPTGTERLQQTMSVGAGQSAVQERIGDKVEDAREKERLETERREGGPDRSADQEKDQNKIAGKSSEYNQTKGAGSAVERNKPAPGQSTSKGDTPHRS